MKRLLSALFLAILPVPAISQDATKCQANWAEIIAAVGPLVQFIPVSGVTAGKNEWCQVEVGNLAAIGLGLEEALFRFDQVSQPLVAGRVIEVALSEFRTPVGTFDGTAVVNLDVENGRVHLLQLELFAQDGRGVRAEADVGLAALTGLSSEQQFGISTVNIDLVVTPNFMAATRINFSQVTRTAVDNALRNVGEVQINGKSRREFLRFVGAASNARGTLSIAGEGDDEVTIFQILWPFLSLFHNPTDTEITAAFDKALEGVTLDLTWKPGRM